MFKRIVLTSKVAFRRIKMQQKTQMISHEIACFFNTYNAIFHEEQILGTFKCISASFLVNICFVS
jgi:hypothetical protein